MSNDDNEHYLFSARVLKQFSGIEFPKWWEFWKQAKRVEWEGWGSVAIPLTKPEGDAFMALDDFAPMRTAFFKAIARSGKADISHISLECFPRVSSYIKTQAQVSDE